MDRLAEPLLKQGKQPKEDKDYHKAFLMLAHLAEIEDYVIGLIDYRVSEMSNIKNFNEFKINEAKRLNLIGSKNKSFIRSIFGKIIEIPLIGLINMLPKSSVLPNIEKSIKRDLDLYVNLENIKEYILSVYDDLTLLQKSEADDRIEEIDNVLRKFPTLSEFKEKLKYTKYLKISQRDLIVDTVDNYEPKTSYDLNDFLDTYVK